MTRAKQNDLGNATDPPPRGLRSAPSGPPVRPLGASDPPRGPGAGEGTAGGGNVAGRILLRREHLGQNQQLSGPFSPKVHFMQKYCFLVEFALEKIYYFLED